MRTLFPWNRSPRRTLVPALLLSLIALAISFANPLQAQTEPKKYTVMKYDEMLKRDTKIPKILRGDKGWELDKTDENVLNADHVRRYFTDYIFAEMTQPEKLNQIPQLRQDFFKLIWRARSEEAYQLVNQTALKVMQQMVLPNNNFHPAVQYNAILILGDLDQNQRSLSGRQIKPIPWNGALRTLIACASNAQFPDHIRAGALIGILRHAELGLPAESREGVVTAMRDILQEKSPPEGRDREVHDWLRRRACQILAATGQTAGDNGVPILLIATMNDPQSSLALRCSAAHALGKLRYEGTLGIDTKKMTDGISNLTLSVCNDAQQRAKALGQKNVARLATARLQQVKSGLAAPAILGSDAEKGQSKEVAALVDTLLSQLNGGSDPTESLRTTTQELATRLGKQIPAADSSVSAELPATAEKTEKKETEKPVRLGGDDPF